MEELREERPNAFIRLRGKTAMERRAEWRRWKKLGYRVAEPDGITVLHEKEAIRRRVLEAFKDIDFTHPSTNLILTLSAGGLRGSNRRSFL
ncbi:MAG: hypothetical protein ACOY9Y_03450 [Bacillota bacterium]